ncbi:MAG TPA: aldose epimerase family protein, partial [Ferruginibacter sp.]|nr:aldose epimerase family protein [Ferruginibacter sp.]
MQASHSLNKIAGLLLCAAIGISCNSQQQAPKENAVSDSSGYSITQTTYGNTDGKAIMEYTIQNNLGMQVGIINYGATVTKILVDDKNKQKANVLLGYDSLAGYLQKKNPYFGCIVGRYANRIGDATFLLNEKKYTLAANDNGQSLHGGLKGFDKVVWDVEKLPGDSGIRLNYFSKDGEEGYPGNVTVSVVYTLSSNNALKIEYSATTDQATPINLTNHCYFNLSGGKDSTILDHELEIKADRFTEVNDVLIPTGKLPEVTNTAMDFRQMKKIGKDIS